MALENFISTIESEALINDRNENLVINASTVTDFIGDIRKRGDSVRVKTFGSPTIYTLNLDGSYTANEVAQGSRAGKGKDVIQKGMPDAEDLSGAEILIPVNQAAMFHYSVGDIDIKQSDDKGRKLFAEARKKSSLSLAKKQDEYSAKVIAGYKDCLIDDTASGISTNGVVTVCNGTVENKTNVLDFVDIAVQLLQQNGISDNTPLVLECSFKFARILKKELRELATDNGELLNGRKVKMFDNIKIVPTKSATVENQEYTFVRTETSVAFINGNTDVENYRPQGKFAEAVIGYNIYDTAIIDPKAIVVTKMAY